MKKILFLVSGGHIPYYTGNGNSVLLFSLLKCFKRLNYNVTVVPICVRSSKEMYESQKKYLENYCKIFEDKTLLSPKHYPLLKFSTLKRVLFPKYTDYFFSKDEVSGLISFYNKNSFDLVYAYDWEAVALFNYFDNKTKLAASLVDLIDEYYKLRWKGLFSHSGPINSLLALVSLIIDRKKPKFAYQALSRSNVIIEHAHQHAEKLIYLGFKNVYYIPHPLPIRGFSKGSLKDVVTISIIGSFKGTASQHGFVFLVEKVLPYLVMNAKEIQKKYEIRIIGHGAFSDSIRNSLEQYKQCKIVGFVDDLEGEYAMADIILVTIPMPHGFRTRIAEAFSYGKCVVAHSANAFGMPEIINGYNALLAENGYELGKILIKAINSIDLRNEIGLNAISTFDSQLSEEIGIIKLEKAFSHFDLF